MYKKGEMKENGQLNNIIIEYDVTTTLAYLLSISHLINCVKLKYMKYIIITICLHKAKHKAL